MVHNVQGVALPFLFLVLRTSGTSQTTCDALEGVYAFNTCLDNASQDIGAVCACVQDFNDAKRRCSLPFAVDGARFWLWLSTPGAEENSESAVLPSTRGGTAKVGTIHDAWEHTDQLLKAFTAAESLCTEPSASLAACKASEEVNSFNACLDSASQNTNAVCACVKNLNDARRRCSLPFAVDGARFWLWLSTPGAEENLESAVLPSTRGGTAKVGTMHDAWEHTDQLLNVLKTTESLCTQPGASICHPTSQASDSRTPGRLTVAVAVWLASIA